jgi:DNA excision repair protein ERCC-1
MDDEFGADADFIAALENVPKAQNITKPAATSSNVPPRPNPSTGVQQPTPQRIVRTSVASVIVNIRQQGNPVLKHFRNYQWEFGDTAADYVVGVGTCVLFLSLKYHLLHPEYVDHRFQALRDKYNLRVLLVLVDVENHQEPLKHLSKTCLINNYTLILSWSAAEAARYLESYKKFERTPPTLIEKYQGSAYKDRVYEFVTTPRTLNKTNAMELLANFGSIKQAINAQPNEINMISGWGENRTKVWVNTVREPFRATSTLTSADLERLERERQVAKGPVTKEQLSLARQGMAPAVNVAAVPPQLYHSLSQAEEGERADGLGENGESGLEKDTTELVVTEQPRRRRGEDVDDEDAGIMAALAKLREQ